MNEERAFEYQTKRPLKVAIFLVLSFVLGFALWSYFYPVIIYSAIFWCGAILMGIPFYVAAEGLGSLGLNGKWLNNWPRPLRICFAVFWLLICMAVLGLVLGLLSSLIVSTS
jgi:hypothetical protein